MTYSSRCLRGIASALVALIVAATSLRAQSEATVEIIGGILAAEDARTFNRPLLEQALVHPDTLVRARAAMAVGRIGDAGGIELLAPLVEQGELNVAAPSLFALGLLRDTATVPLIVRRLGSAPALDLGAAVEGITALARIGGPAAVEFLTSVLEGRAQLEVSDTVAIREQAALEAWRLGNLLPTSALLSLLGSEKTGLRWKALYSLTRQRTAAAIAGQRIVGLARDREAVVRQLVARALSAGYMDAAGISRETAADVAVSLIADEDPGVRINTLRALGTLKVASSVERIASRLVDPVGNVEVQATQALGEIGGPEAVAVLLRQISAKRPFAVRREALLGLAKSDTAELRKVLPSWATASDWRERMVAGEAAALAWHGAGARPFLSDRDGRVVNSALAGWVGAVAGPNAELTAAARPLVRHSDASVRATAASALARSADPADVPALVAAYRHAARDSFPDAAQSALEALAAIAKTDAGRETVERDFLSSTSASPNYLLRAWAETNWPALTERWGPAYPMTTGRSTKDYRELARRLVIPGGADMRPHVTVEVEGKGSFELELFSDDAPLTVANFLALVDRRFFDGNRWHRVVPNFVVQDGDPRGDGNGGPGGAIRDEINRHRYDGYVLGMALSGPDTGSSQWFITLSQQPHLDGTYTVFGRVVSGHGTINRVLQGDVIRRIHR